MRTDTKPWRLSLLFLVMMAAACAGSDDSEGSSGARERYNAALAQLESGDWKAAAEGFLEARQNAGVDAELRYRAAYNLGLSHVHQADAESEPKAALEQLGHSAAWLRDAVSLRPDDEEARVALEKVLRRIQVLADQLNKGENSLEARLDRVIADHQAKVLEPLRQLMLQVAESGSGADPIAFQSSFERLATAQRTLWADVSTIADLAAEELGLLEGKKAQDPDAPALSQEEEVRMVQLQSLQRYLQAARAHMGDARRRLHRLQGETAHRKADVALAELERAREQLMDPVTVLKAIAQDQMLLGMHTGALAELRKAAITVRPDGAEQGDQAAGPGAAAGSMAPPPWLTNELLGDRQDDIEQRAAEILARFAAAAAARQEQHGAGAGEPAAAAGSPEEVKQQRILAAAGQAVPLLEQATAAMRASAGAIAGDRLAEAMEHQKEATRALIAAIERFSGIRELIELAYGEHQGTVALLTPPDQAELPPEAARELAKLSTRERVQRIREAVTRNVDRMSRLQGLFGDEIAMIEQQAAQAQAPADANAPAPEGDGQAEQLEAAKQQYLQAEELRNKAYQALERVRVATEAAGAGRGKAGEALAAAQEAQIHIEELRRLFYSIVEHLKELLQHQTATQEATAAAGVGPADQLAIALGPLVAAQQGHASLGEALANALAQQADAAVQGAEQGAAQGPGPGGGPAQDPQKAQEMAQRLVQAAEETRQAAAQMTGAGTTLSQAAEQAAAMSPDLTPTLDAQQAAMEHLESAIRLLEPPQEQDQEQQEQDQQEQDQEQQEQDQEQEQDQDQDQQQYSQQQAQRRLQELRDREAERRRNREPAAPEPVEKDW